MKSTVSAGLAVLALAAALGGCASLSGDAGWLRLVDGTQGLDNFNRVGEANWAATDGAIVATQGGKTPAYLVSKANYGNFRLRAEFWASDDANSGIFMRCQDPAKITDENCYEANIFDQRPDQTYATGAVVQVAPVAQPAPRAGGKWNTFDITMRGTHLVVMLNGQKTIDVNDGKFASGPVALQWGRGTIKFRKVEIMPL
jgi:hypothetical protein